MAFSRLPYNFEEALAEVKSWRASYKPPQKEWTEENVIAWCSERAIKAAKEFKPDWDAMAVMVEEQQRMAKRIEDLEAMLERQTARIVELQEHIENFDGEDR